MQAKDAANAWLQLLFEPMPDYLRLISIVIYILDRFRRHYAEQLRISESVALLASTKPVYDIVDTRTVKYFVKHDLPTGPRWIRVVP